jgi:replicative DNA helicase
MTLDPNVNDLATAALRYAADGLQVFPANPNTKAPLTVNGMKDATDDPRQVRQWWHDHPTALIACRIPEGVIVLDVDPRHGGDTTWAELERHYQPISAGRTHLSGRGDGGAHHWFRAPNGPTSIKPLRDWASRNGVGHKAGNNSWTSGIDILHHNHRYTILPPSPHPETGQPYTWEQWGTPAPMPPWLEQLITKPDTPTPPPRLRTVKDETSIADWFTDTHTWAEILTPSGWVIVAGDGDSDGSKWRHPNASAEHSATIKHGCLFVFSDNTDFTSTEDGDPNGYTRFRAWATLEHGGDMSAAAYEAFVRRDGPPVDLGSLIGPPQATQALPDDPWDAPEALAGQIAPTPFPTHIFPAWIKDQINLASTEMQCPPDLPAQLAITALSIAAAGHARVHVANTWHEPLNTYLVTGLKPGENKSPNVKLMLGPLDEWEQHLQDSTEEERGRTETKHKVLTKQYNKATDKGETAEALAIWDEISKLPSMVTPRIIADDATPEKLADLLATHNGRMAIVSTEGGVFSLMTGRYSDKSNLDVYLMAWSGDTIRIDRIGREGGQIRNPALTVGLTVQPTVIAKLADIPELRGRGLTARFMYSVPQSRVGHRNMAQPSRIDMTVISAYRDHLLGIASDLHRYDTPATIAISDDAYQTLIDWRQNLEERRRPGGDLTHMVEWSIKMESTVIRLAGLLHIAHGYHLNTAISVDTMRDAITCGDYWQVHARIAHELWIPDPVTANAARILDWALEAGRDRFTIRDAYGMHRAAMPTANDALEPIQLLIDKGWVRMENGEPLEVGKRGKKSPNVCLHPEAAAYRGRHLAGPTITPEPVDNFETDAVPVDNPVDNSMDIQRAIAILQEMG